MEEQNNPNLEEQELEQQELGENKEVPTPVTSNNPFPTLAIGAIVVVAIILVLITALGGNKGGNIVCQSCGADILGNVKFCPDCGNEVALPNDNNNDNKDENNSNIKEIYMNEVGIWSNGVEFQIYNHKETSEIDTGLYKYTTNDKYLIIGLRVYNGSSSTFTSSATDVWLLLDDTKILQQNIVEKYAQGYDDISQSATVTKEYFLFFEIGKNVSMGDLKLVINNGETFSSESVVIKLQNAPKDSNVELNYSYDGKKENYKFYSGTSIVPSNFPTPSREGYTFSGWYFNEDYSGEPLTSLVLEKNQNLSLYAKWDVINVNIVYNGNGSSSGQTISQVAQIGTSITLSENGFTKEGFYFVGWTESIGSNIILSPNTIYNLSLSQNDLTLYAKWAKDIYTIEDFNTINENNDCIFVLHNDIDFSILSANTVTIFNGIFDGNHFKLKNSATPLFINNNGIIRNAIIEDCELSRSDNYFYNDLSFYDSDFTFNSVYGGLVAINKGIIENSLVKLSNSKDFTDNISCFGGIAAINEGGIISCCKTDISATHDKVSQKFYWGGIVGVSTLSNNVGAIKNCYSIGTLDLPQNGEDTWYIHIGGILGYGINTSINNSLSNIDMTISMNYTSRKFIGGILGETVSTSGMAPKLVIDSCVTIGNITCPDTYTTYVGGIACYKDIYTINNCFSNSSIKSISPVQNGNKVASDSFVQADFYLNNNILNSFVDSDTLEHNENAVWVIVDGKLPTLYWEK